MLTPWRAVSVLAIWLLLAGAANAASLTVRPNGSSAVGTNSVLLASVGATLGLEVVLDTEGLTFEGYSYGMDFIGGDVSGLAVMHESFSGLAEDIFGAPVTNDAAGTIRNVNQAKLSAGPGLVAGIYVLDTISFTANVIPDPDGILATVGLFGEVLGLGEGSCPGTVQGCNVQTFATTIQAPEPTVGLPLVIAAVAAGARTLAIRRPV